MIRNWPRSVEQTDFEIVRSVITSVGVLHRVWALNVCRFLYTETNPKTCPALLSPSLPGWLHCRLPHKIKFALHQKIFKNCMQQPRTNRASKRFLYFSPVGPSKPVTLHADFEKNGMSGICYPKWCPPAPSRPRVRMTCQRMLSLLVERKVGVVSYFRQVAKYRSTQSKYANQKSKLKTSMALWMKQRNTN